MRPVLGKRFVNLARFQNGLYRHARGDFLWLLNDDVEIIEPDWLRRRYDMLANSVSYLVISFSRLSANLLSRSLSAAPRV